MFLINPYRYAAGAADPSFASVIALLHFNGADGSTTYTDQIAGNSWSAGTGCSISTAQSKFGGSSFIGSSNASSGTVGTTDAADAFGTGDFTAECWVYPTTLSGGRGIMDFRTGAGSTVAPVVYVSGASLRVNVGGSLVITGSNLSTNTWYHVALSRVSGTSRLFVDGTQVGSSYTDSNNYVNQDMAIGRLSATGGAFIGHIDDVRVTKGVGRYSANFTAPTAQFPDY
jgi:hypothetical protein